MSYRFKALEGFGDGVRRIGCAQIDGALAALAGAGEPAKIVHGTRKTLKRLRALLRLARPGLPREVYAAENAQFRDIGRSLSAARDGQVTMDTLALLERSAKGRRRAALAALRVELADRPGAPRAAVGPALLADVRTRLAEARVRMAWLPVAGREFDGAFAGIERTYREAGEAMVHAFDTGDDEDMHEFRKRIQHHWRHMQLVSLGWPAHFDARAATARQLSQLLGEDHDIAVLIACAGGPGAPLISAGQMKLVRAHAQARQGELRREAALLGGRLLASSPRRFRKDVARHWELTRTSGAVTRAAKPAQRAAPGA